MAHPRLIGRLRKQWHDVRGHRVGIAYWGERDRKMTCGICQRSWWETYR